MFNKEEFVGKTIVDVDTTTVNYVVFTFHDGSKAALETEHHGNGIYGIDSVKPQNSQKINNV